MYSNHLSDYPVLDWANCCLNCITGSKSIEDDVIGDAIGESVGALLLDKSY